MDKIEIFIPIAVAFVGGILGLPIVHFFNFFQRRKLQKITNALEANSLFDKFEDNFKTEFILPDLKEAYFYIQTGIMTNEKSIIKYIEFKNKLGWNYTWAQIKIVQPHLDIKSEEIKISLNMSDKIYGNLVLIFWAILFLIGFILFIYLNQFKIQGTKEIIIVLSGLVIPSIFGYLLVASANSIFIAKHMEKRLNNKLTT